MMSSDRYFSVTELENAGFNVIPKVFFVHERYKQLSYSAKLYWSILNDLHTACYRKGWIDEETSRVYFYNPEMFIDELVDPADADDHASIFKELEQHQLLEIQPTNYPNLVKYYLLKPHSEIHVLTQLDKLKLSYINNIKQYIDSKTAEISTVTPTESNTLLLKKFLIDLQIDDETVVSELYNHCIQTSSKLTYKDIEEMYSMFLGSINNEVDNHDSHAIQIINDYFDHTDLVQLTDTSKLVIFKHLDKIIQLKKYNKFSLSLIITKKNKHSLSPETFNYLLDEALSLYQLDKDHVLDFTLFFENVISHQDMLENKERLIEEIDTKLFGLPDHLKKFVYDQMKKYKENFPKRYELILNNLRSINTIYCEHSELSDDIFEKAFRRLFNDKEVFNISSYFKKGIGYIQKELEKKKPLDSKLIQVTENTLNQTNWVNQVVHVKETEGDIEKMDAQERAEYFKRGEELKNKLNRLTKGGK